MITQNSIQSNTKVKVKLLRHKPGNVRAYAALYLGDLVIQPIKIVVKPHQAGQVSWPKLMSDGAFYPLIVFTSEDLRQELESLILEAYDNEVRGS